MYTMTFTNATNSNDSVGSKALNLIKMKQQGLPVPDGFIVQPNTFRRFMEANEITLDDELLQEKMLHAKMPPDVESELLAAFETIKQAFNAVAVRSSSSAEDLENTSFAGQYETYLNVKTKEELIMKIKACWSSAFAERVRHYFKTMNIDLTDISMSVVVQGLVKSEVSGVIFSQNPVTDNASELMINASYGLGEAIVSGLVTPDAFLVNKTTYEAVKELGLKEMKILADDEGTKEVATAEAEQCRFCLTDSVIHQLTALTNQLEAFFGYPVDVEFAVKQDQVYLLQARPITTVASID